MITQLMNESNQWMKQSNGDGNNSYCLKSVSMMLFVSTDMPINYKLPYT